MSKSSERIEVHPLTPDKWKDLELLFGEKGAVGGCWCMWWRIKRSDYDKYKGEENKKSFKKIVEKEIPGLLIYSNGIAAGWCSIQPREKYPVLQNSRILKSVDDKPVWSIVCFFIKSEYRRKGLSIRLIKEAVKYAKKNGAKIIEGYPHEPKKDKMPDVFAHTGIKKAFDAAGFVEVERRSEQRPIMRYFLK